MFFIFFFFHWTVLELLEQPITIRIIIYFIKQLSPDFLLFHLPTWTLHTNWIHSNWFFTVQCALKIWTQHYKCLDLQQNFIKKRNNNYIYLINKFLKFVFLLSTCDMSLWEDMHFLIQCNNCNIQHTLTWNFYFEKMQNLRNVLCVRQWKHCHSNIFFLFNFSIRCYSMNCVVKIKIAIKISHQIFSIFMLLKFTFTHYSFLSFTYGLSIII